MMVVPESVGDGRQKERISVKVPGRDSQTTFRHYLHNCPRLKWFAWFGNIVMVLAAFTSMAHASSLPSSPPNPYGLPIVYGFHANHAFATVNQKVTFFANVTGGIVGGTGSSCSSTFSCLHTNGYHVLWFFGGGNATGDLNEKTVNVPANKGCTSSTSLCTLNTTINASYAYGTPGSYNVSITVYDSDYNFTIATTTVVVSYAGFSVHIFAPCNKVTWPGSACSRLDNNPARPPFTINTPIEFTADATGATSGLFYRWDFGDGNASSAQYPKHGFARNGSYMVSVTATDSSTGQVARAFVNVSITLLPITIPCGMIIGWPSNGTAGVPVQFSLPTNIDPNPDDYTNLTASWNFGDGTIGIGLNTTHIYTSAGTYYPAVSHISDVNIVPPIQTTACPPPSGSLVINGTLSALHGKGVSVPVGQVAFFNAPNYENAPQGSALLNYSWSSGTGSSYGLVGRTSSFTVQNESVSLTVKDPYASQNLQTSTYANFLKVKPTVGVDSLYTQAQITVSIGNTYYAENVTIVLLENGKNVSWYNLWWYSGSVTFYPIDFQMADNWALLEHYTPYGSSGSSSVTTKFAWTACNNNGCKFTNNVYVSQTFYNSNPPSKDNYNVPINKEALGQWSFPTEVLFSPAQTTFYETDSFGFGTNQHYNDSAPSTAEPTLDTYPWEVLWAAGKNYTFNITACDAWGMCGYSQITVYDKYNFSVSDMAPVISAPIENPGVTAVPGTSITFQANVTSQTYLNASVKWQFGDGGTTSYSSAGSISTATHIYQYGSRYALIAYAKSMMGNNLSIKCPPACGGELNANWTWITVSDIKPNPAFTASTSTPLVYQTVRFDGSHTTENGQTGLTNLAFSWSFGDGAIAQGYGTAGDITSHSYAAAGSYTVTLTVQNRDGVSNSVSTTVTVGSTAPSFSFPGRTMTVDSYMVFTPPSHDLASSPFVQATWTWGDGTQTVGFGAGHTYLKPGNYTATLSLSGGVFGSGTSKSGVVTAKDDPLTVVLPYGGYVAYGKNHTESFIAQILGSYADSYPTNYSLTFSSVTWQWGDGSTNGMEVNLSGGLNFTDGHPYILTGIFGLNVTATGPSPSNPWFASKASWTASINSVPDADADGLPNTYESAITGTNPFLPDSANRYISYQGNGLTDYVGPYLTAIGNLSADPDSDGLTNLQEIMGSVTGFPSNPLDPNTAGDGIPDGSHFFSESFRNDNVSAFGTRTNISGVWYAGPVKSFHDASLLVDVNTSAAVLGSVAITLVDPWGDPVPLASGMTSCSPGATSCAETFLLLNSTPTGGEVDHFPGIGLSQFQRAGTWHVLASASGQPGQILEANLALSYYTNPSLADPTHQGLVQGHGITVPLVNCSEAWNATYPVFDPTTGKMTHPVYAPYTEQYYKLSVVQGIPYVPGYNQSVYNANLASYNKGTCNFWGVSNSALLGDTASYLGDADFGISPWVSDATGDTQRGGGQLTNGMKALGKQNYSLTAGFYQPYSGGTRNPSGFTGYAPDTMWYPWPLNPAVQSTEYDGAPDGYTMASGTSTSPLALAVTISSATDANCYYTANPVDQISVNVNQGGSTTPTIFSEAHYPYVSSTGYCNNDFSYSDSYTMPLNNSRSQFNLTFTLWHNADPTGDVKWSGTWSGSVANGYSGNTGTDPQCGGTCNGVTASWKVMPMLRAHVVLVGNGGETQMLPGYGTHYVGEQQFYAFYLSVTGTSGPKDPFQASPSGTLNVLLVSRASYLSTNLSANQSAGSLGAVGCLGSAQVTTRNLGGSQLGLAGTLSATVTDSCANTLLANLMPHNSTGNITGTYYSLSTPQVQLLGLDAGASQVSPFLPIPGFDSVQGGLPSQFNWGIFPILGGVIVAVGNFFHVPAIVALGNWVANLPAEVAAAVAYLGQIVVGIWNAVVSAVEAAVQAAISALNFLVQIIEAIFTVLTTAIANAVMAAVSNLGLAFAVPYLSTLADNNVNGSPILGSTDYGNTIHQMGGAPSGVPESNNQASADMAASVQNLLAVSAIVTATVAIGTAIAIGLSAGGFSGMKTVLTQVANRLFTNDIKSLGTTALGTAIGILIYAALQSGNAQAYSNELQVLGVGSTITSLAIVVPAFIQSFSYFSLTIRNAAKAGIFVALGLAMISNVCNLMTNALSAVQSTYGTNEKMPMIYTTGLAILLSAFALGFTTPALARALILSGFIFPVDLTIFILSGVGLGVGVYDLKALP